MDTKTYKISLPGKNRVLGFSFVIACTLLIVMMIAGCGDSVTDAENDTNGNDNGNGTPTSSEVSMEGISFVPANLTVEVGTTVTWTNNSNVIHTVTSGTDGNHDGLFDSGNVAANEQFSYTFNETGTYPYFCIPHVNQGMTGTIIVEEAD
ncbi:cupredoxin domain-containing protein [Rhodohalobacter sp. 8-1]|uniref:cupredoxin domain-containing protein n=1 Tax=Rhodohalobacter sp. 8-1 TaxID=3131972 RepID=UPI0030EE2FA5